MNVRKKIFFFNSFLSSINPIVYAFMSKNFREAFKHIFKTCLCSKKKNYTSFYNTNNNNTSFRELKTKYVKPNSDLRSSLQSDNKRSLTSVSCLAPKTISISDPMDSTNLSDEENKRCF